MRARYFILGPVIVALAFTLPNKPMIAVQVIAGVAYFCLGFRRL
jgi:hypothetical protein